MDYQVKGDFMFKILKNIIIEENKELLNIIAKRYKKDIKMLEQKYLRQEYYLPLVLNNEHNK
jgi:hypothetical protein